VEVLDHAALRIQALEVHVWPDSSVGSRQVPGGHPELPQSISRPEDSRRKLSIAASQEARCAPKERVRIYSAVEQLQSAPRLRCARNDH